jgi:hypothetical protein
MKAVKKKTKPIPPPEPDFDEVEEIDAAPPVVDEVESAEASVKESDVNELQRVLAEVEYRLENIKGSVEVEIDKRVNDAINRVGEYLAAAEMRMFSRMSEFFMQNPLWEIHKLTKANTGAGNFYNPYKEYQRLISQGWKWMGRHFDPEKMESYDLFIRQKKLPEYKEQVVKLYKEFLEPKPVPVSATRPTGVKLKVSTTTTKK